MRAVVLQLLVVAAAALALASGIAAVEYASFAPAASLVEVGGCTNGVEPAPAQPAGCCSGFQCPYAGGVCCGGLTFCCPNGTICLASGGAVAPQCGTPARDVCACQGQPACGCQGQNAAAAAAAAAPGGFGVAGGTPAVPNGDAGRPEKLSATKADEFGAGEDIGGAVEWKVVRPKSEESSGEKGLEPLGPKVHSTNFTVDLRLDVSNFMYTFYITQPNVVNLKLREDIARNENMAVQSVEIVNVSPLRLRTEGSPAMETAYLKHVSRNPRFQELADAVAARGGDDGDDDDDDDDDDDSSSSSSGSGAALVEAGARFTQLSGIRVEARVYCGSEDHAQALARHIFLTFDRQNPHPFNFKALQGFPPEAHGNAALPFDVLPESKVFLGDAEVHDRQGIAVARHARAEAAVTKAAADQADVEARRLIGQENRERARVLRVNRREARLDAIQRQRRQAAAAAERARQRAEEAKKAAHKADVLARHEAVQKREASEAGVKERQQKAREEYQKKHAPKANVTKVEWDVTTKPVSYAESVQACGGDAARMPQWSFAGDLCVLSGKVCAAEGVEHLRRPLVSTPRECRPAARLIFNRHDATRRTFRVDGWTSGRLAWNGGFTKSREVSLDGIVFPREGNNKTQPLELAAGWVPYGGPFAAPSVFHQDTLCVVTGLARVKEGNVKAWTDERAVIAKLPEGCRPDGRLVFNLNHHKYTMRVDVLPNGDVEYVDGPKKYKWVSLSGVTFFSGAAANGTTTAKLGLLNGYKPFGLGYREPTVTRQENLCALSGVVTGSTALVVGNMPRECRPVTGVLSFFTNQGSRSFRIDVHADGSIRRVPPVFDSWVALDGIFYAAGTPQAWEGKAREEATALLNKQKEAAAAKAAADKQKK